MSVVVEHAADLAARPTTLLARLRGRSATYRLPVYVACTVLTLVTNYLLGKDMAWDTLNYHLYAGFSVLNDRFAQDYFAAGPLSYLNPYAYVPFYALVRAGVPALAIGSLFAVAHSVFLWLTFELALAVTPSSDPRTRLAIGICAVALAFMNPILMQQIGSSFADITTAILVLAGWLLLSEALRSPHAARLACAGLLLGAATALKLTNGVHAVAAFAMFLAVPRGQKGTLRSMFGLVIAMGVGFTVLAAPWSYRLEQMFGNPFFPLMNDVFRSPYFTTEPLHPYRFLPHSLGDALLRPFAMVNPVIAVHEEMKAPDLRYALLASLTVALGLQSIWHRLMRRPPPAVPAEERAPAGTLRALAFLLAADWILYLVSSGNSRYFLPMTSIAAVVAIAWLFKLCAAQPKVRNYALLAIFASQGIQLSMGADLRWNPHPWDGQWFSLTVPQKLASEPNLYLTMGVQSNSYVAPYLERGSGLVNFSGGYALAPESANGARVQALIRRFAPHVRVLVRGARLYKDWELREPRLARVDAALGRFDLRVDPADCATIAVNGLRPELEITWATFSAGRIVEHPLDDTTTYLVSCRVVPDHADHSAQIARDRIANLALDHLEDACPTLFQPRRLVTERDGDTWQRLYMNTDLTAWVSHGKVKFISLLHDTPMTELGLESEWATAPPRLACGRRNGHFFASALPKVGP